MQVANPMLDALKRCQQAAQRVCEILDFDGYSQDTKVTTRLGPYMKEWRDARDQLEKIKKEERTPPIELGQMIFSPMEPIPVGENPMIRDQYHMGQRFGQNLMIMFEKHAHEFQKYIILTDMTTGEKVSVEFATPQVSS